MSGEIEVQDGARRSIVADVSREIVGIYSRFYGRGPTKAKTVYHHDVVVTVLDEIFSKAEQVLVNAGHFPQVRSNRQAFQDEVGPLFRQVVETLTGRRVRAFLSQVNEDGVAVEVFVLEPAEPAEPRAI